jgi:hypothetical protein
MALPFAGGRDPKGSSTGKYVRRGKIGEARGNKINNFRNRKTKWNGRGEEEGDLQ